MARKLKTYKTSVGFFELAVAAPSMKAALEAWGSDTNLFQLGAAKETDETSIVEATMAKPGVVLKRPVGTHGAFTINAQLPKHLPVNGPDEKPLPPRSKTEKPTVEKPGNEKAARAAALAFEKEQKQREAERRKGEAARERERQRREQAIAKAEAALEEARMAHVTVVRQIEQERAFLDRRTKAEDERWGKKKGDLEAALQRVQAGSPPSLKFSSS